MFWNHLSKSERAKFILIKDTLNLSGRNILKSLVKLFIKEESNIFLICYDLLPGDLTDGLDINHAKFQVCDGFSDPLVWDCRGRTTYGCILSEIIYQFSLENSAVIIVDSLSPMLFHQSIEKLYRSLHSLLNHEKTQVQLVALFHSDVHSEKESSMLEALATSVVEISCPRSDRDVMCSITCQSPRGNVSQEFIRCRISETYDISMVNDTSPKKETAFHHNQHSDPTANLTFNLKIKDDEKEIRDSLVMPYAKSITPCGENEENTCLLDDFSDDDPDDDLII